MFVYAEPGVAKDPLHYPVTLTGIISDSEVIYINRPPPPPLPPPSPPPPDDGRKIITAVDNTTSTSSTTGASQTSRETEESILT